MIKGFKNITDEEIKCPVLRYLTFAKFISLLEFKALWFCKLNVLIDEFEGKLPTKPRQKMLENQEELKKTFTAPEFQESLNRMTNDHEKGGRELTAVCCWYFGDTESLEMWQKYVPNNEGVAVKSTVKKLSECIFTHPEYSQIGKVQYVNFNEYEMTPYEAHQANERALLKRKEFEGEQEIRIITLNFITPWCLNNDGSIPSPQQCSGPGMNNLQNPGLYIKANLESLIEAIIVAPKAKQWFLDLVQLLARKYGLPCPIYKSNLN